jgi:hypothetical protein
MRDGSAGKNRPEGAFSAIRDILESIPASSGCCRWRGQERQGDQLHTAHLSRVAQSQAAAVRALYLFCGILRF